MADPASKPPAAQSATPQTLAKLKALLEAGLQAKQANQPAQAEEKFRVALKLSPRNAQAQFQLGTLLSGLGRYEEAEPLLAAAAAAMDKDAIASNNLGNLYRRTKQLDKARAALERALRIDPDLALAHQNLAYVLHGQKEHEAALAHLDRYLAKEPGQRHALQLKAAILEALDRKHEVAEVLLPLLETEKGPHTRFLARWTSLMIEQARIEEALPRLRDIAARWPDSLPALIALGSTASKGEYLDEAHSFLSKAQALDPTNSNLCHDLGAIERFRGNLAEANGWFDKALGIFPGHPQALRAYGIEHKYAYGDAAFQRLNTATAHIADAQPVSRVQLHYALGKAYDDVGELGTAFEHFIEGGKLHRKLNPADEDGFAERLAGFMKGDLTPELFARLAGQGEPSDLPVFIVGMPRSGTTLTEQVIASHPETFGAGELKLLSNCAQWIVIGKKRLDIGGRTGYWSRDQPASFAERGRRYVEELRKLAPPGARRVVDKMPANFFWVGLIQLILPNAHIIHTRRHPVEICLSCFRLFFPDGQLWSYDLKDLGRAYRRYHDLMAHWRSVLPGKMLEIRYEDMVTDLPTHARAIIDYLGLPWDEACLNYHETERTVRTASAVQVRKPIYRTSMNRWRKYEPYLKPLLDEIGDLVEQYEAEIAHLSAQD